MDCLLFSNASGPLAVEELCLTAAVFLIRRKQTGTPEWRASAHQQCP
jgi:hypothetical protein